jgi:hypothetical protein
VRFYSAHLKPRQEPVLVPERFAWGAFVFGPLWLLLHGAWVGAGLTVAAIVLTLALVPPIQAAILLTGLLLLLGLLGHDIRRWSLERRGFVETNVICAHNELMALKELLHERPDLAERYRPSAI